MEDAFEVIERFQAAGLDAASAIIAAKVALGHMQPSRATVGVSAALIHLPPQIALDVQQLCDAHNVTAADVMGRGRTHTVSRARNACFAAARARGLSYPEIGRLFSRDHSSVMNGLERHRQRTRATPAQSQERRAGE